MVDEPVLAPVPNITFHALSDQPTKVFVHLGDKIRTFTEGSIARLRVTLKNVLIAEFGMQQDNAESYANEAVDADGIKAAEPDHIALLQEQLADTDKQLTDMTAAKMIADANLSQMRDELKVARNDIAGMKAEMVKVEHDTEDAAQPGGVILPPPATDPPQIPAAAMRTAATGGGGSASTPVPVPADVAALMPVGETQPHDPRGPHVPGAEAASVFAREPPVMLAPPPPAPDVSVTKPSDSAKGTENGQD